MTSRGNGDSVERRTVNRESLSGEPHAATVGRHHSTGLAAAAAVSAFLVLLMASALGMSSLRAGQEGLPPLLAIMASMCLGLATMMMAGMSRAWADRRDPVRRSSGGQLRVVTTLALAVAAYLFISAAPVGLPYANSWAGVVGAAVGLWIGLALLMMSNERRAWAVAAGWCLGLLVVSAAAMVL